MQGIPGYEGAWRIRTAVQALSVAYLANANKTGPAEEALSGRRAAPLGDNERKDRARGAEETRNVRGGVGGASTNLANANRAETEDEDIPIGTCQSCGAYWDLRQHIVCPWCGGTVG